MGSAVCGTKWSKMERLFTWEVNAARLEIFHPEKVREDFAFIYMPAYTYCNVFNFRTCKHLTVLYNKKQEREVDMVREGTLSAHLPLLCFHCHMLSGHCLHTTFY